MQSYQPYGQQMMAPPPPGGRNPFKAFGITYMAVRGIVVVLLLFFAVVLLTIDAGSGASNDVGGMAALRGIAAVIALVGVVWLGYVIAAGVMALKGMVASVYMGFADAGLTTIFAFWTVAQGEVGPFFCWMIPNAAIFTLGILALKKRNAPDPYGASYPPYGVPSPYGAQNHYPPQYGAPTMQPAHAYPQPLPPGPPVPQSAPRPVQGGTSAAVPSPKQAALGILALAASVDPDLTEEALTRARAVAAKLLGTAAQARIQRQLAQPVNVMDVERDLWQHTSILNHEGNPQMKGNVVKAVQYVLKGPTGIEPLGEQFIATLKQQLGV